MVGIKRNGMNTSEIKQKNDLMFSNYWMKMRSGCKCQKYNHQGVYLAQNHS